jgi:hypothetical protein
MYPLPGAAMEGKGSSTVGPQDPWPRAAVLARRGIPVSKAACDTLVLGPRYAISS